MFYSPLRYPGGKGKLEPFMEMLIEQTGHTGGIYIEPFAGGAGIALELLEKNVVSEIVINDLDKGIYSFWRAMLTETDRFVNDILNAKFSIEEWNRQRAFINNSDKYSYELGFATFYLNRTNRSGIIKGGVIGGIEQSGNWKMDARFNKQALVERIVKIAKRRDSIHLYNKDVTSFIRHYLPKYEENAFVYFDPPYFGKGKQLYLNFDWVITYDDVQEIADIYHEHTLRRFDLNYSAAVKRKASEIIIFRRDDMVPTIEQLTERKICVNLR